MNLGLWLFVIGVFWLGALTGAGFLAILIAHGQREKAAEGERIPVEVDS